MSGADFGAQLGNAAEATVVALAMSGEGRAFAELVRRRQAWLRRLLRRLCHDPALADDLAQQVLLAAWRHLPQLKSVSAFGAWLRRMAINAWWRQCRAASRDAALEEIAEPIAATSADAGVQLDLEGALQQLSAEQRLCVVLAYSEGMSHGEIASATALPLGTVKSHVKRGAERLRHLLEAYRAYEDHAHAG
jgi:RNA polymerase sigma factor (sigma-70 family)